MFIYMYYYVFLFQVALLGMDIVSALVTRLQNRFKPQIGTGKHVAYCLKRPSIYYRHRYFLELTFIVHD